MTAPPAERSFRASPLFPWIMLLVGLVAGIFIGRMSYSMAQAKLGNCVSADTARVVATGVSPGQCEDMCDDCSWVQGGVR